MAKALNRALLCVLICFVAGAASAQVPIAFSWSEQVSLARDSGGVLLDASFSATVIWDADKSGLGEWNPLDPIPTGDQVVLDFNDVVMSAPFGSGPFLGHFVGNWTADDNDGWTQDDEWLYLLAYVPAAFSSSGLDEYGVSLLMPIVAWPNMGVSHDIVGGGPINTAPIPEPATIMLVAGGLGLLFFRRRK